MIVSPRSIAHSSQPLAEATSLIETDRLKPNLYQLLITSDDALDFFKEAFECLKSSNRAYSYGMLARAGGIASASYLREVLNGKRSLTPKGFAGICKAYRLNKEGVELLRLMLALKDKAFNPGRQSAEEISTEIDKHRKLIIKKSKFLRIHDVHPEKFNSPLSVSRVIAAMGSDKTGASLDDLIFKTMLPKQNVLQIVEFLSLKGILKETKDERYLLVENKIIFDSEGEDSFIKRLYLEAMEHHAQKARQSFKDQSNINLVYTFSASKDKIETARNRIRQIIQDLVDESEDPTGEEIYTLVFGLSADSGTN